jgi:hypothetical protein
VYRKVPFRPWDFCGERLREADLWDFCGLAEDQGRRGRTRCMRQLQFSWKPLPDPLPSPGSGRFRWLRDLRTSLAANVTAPRLSVEELVDRRVCRGAVQALVREAYEVTVAEQDSIEMPGWSVITTADLDTSLV